MEEYALERYVRLKENLSIFQEVFSVGEIIIQKRRTIL